MGASVRWLRTKITDRRLPQILLTLLVGSESTAHVPRRLGSLVESPNLLGPCVVTHDPGPECTHDSGDALTHCQSFERVMVRRSLLNSARGGIS
jgi:hypothetical protein